MVSDPEGQWAVRWAREALDRALGTPRTSTSPVPSTDRLPDVFAERRGVFVTLKRFPSGDLRGCIGFPLPVLPLKDAIAEAAVAAAREDPRFRPVVASESGRLTVEVSVLTLPVTLPSGSPEERRAGVRVGRDGLIVEGWGASGLLLPQVAPEQGWSAEELLEGTCEKAGLPPQAWRDPAVRVRRFEAEVFVETAPYGEVVRERTDLTGSSEPPTP